MAVIRVTPDEKVLYSHVDKQIAGHCYLGCEDLQETVATRAVVKAQQELCTAQRSSRLQTCRVNLGLSSPPADVSRDEVEGAQYQ
ncbi:hypothetical protein PoB_002763600 [Plakobranchus ocellatus]|uniref:Uncharacterized protein n=1 Tax=Plakobranchus ocellatus TaxID=259542 RepID=A0AAV3ZYY4_9GAST|nr:hypothetical protein PoB_002763600 [Plakobranchus ocellatus]